MSKEQAYLNFVQIVVSINTIVLLISVILAKRGNLIWHKRLSSFAVITTLAGVIGLVITLFMGWHYRDLTSPMRMLIHRSFAGPLLPSLIFTAVTGFTGNRKWHLRSLYLTMPFWFGTLITGLWFF